MTGDSLRHTSDDSGRQMVEYEDILVEVGQIGWYQLSIVLIIETGWCLNTGMDMLLLMFVGANPGWTCPDPSAIYNQSVTNYSTGLVTTATTLYYVYENSTESVLGDGVVQNGCGVDNKICPGYVFNTDYTSIVTEVTKMYIVKIADLEQLLFVITVPGR
ncbi:uncharacterized protein LOC106168292 [Lingula anatina]|uniref:Uncharacterized protein LOC106168290 n=1 Tax=Lingula anatina TaxID=7574 RepID=A0A1S3IYY5_LINAN|nr:uncharacterized protein LOC106168290 [Lingula anatina]XP_013402759.1 uncharacterized protein LOC106168292 [Lingula anatina]XP_013402760.1 uncharacterized protein LOC106168292 [Lingula anatina]|eukprot:XP_013402755.1 uncharacterized protein LOC106168290 [Lingula anatina]